VLDGFADPGLQGSDPGGLAFDNAGRLYGTAGGGGQFADGVTFLLGQVSVFNWYEIVAHAFAGGNDGDNPGGPLTFDASGNIYGTTMDGGPHSAGIVYKLMPNHSSFGWSETILYEFTGSSDGSQPNGVIFDTAGNLFGTTSGGGSTGEGTVFELTPNSDGGWSESVLHSFAGGSDGAAPQSQVTFDTGGNLYGTTLRGGSGGAGTAFQLTPSGGQWSETVLYSFCGGSDGGSPYGEVILDNAGNLYGTASAGGAYGSGVAFEISR